ncbi:MAG: M20/M25/M40 family metallo-hydrolase [Gemmatimonadetes bacterium]|nr:M20/M25/M40 family metallo-hydrolase [Gemmatimonadota bacterium]
MMEELLRTVTELPGPTGEEEAVLAGLETEWAGRGELKRSPIGNLTLRIPGAGPRVVLAAHADELSMIVRSVTADGFLRIVPGERDQFASPYFIGTPLRILASRGPLAGIFASTTGHSQTLEQRDKTRLSWDDVYVDTGLTAADLKERGVGIGTRMVWEQPLRKMGRLLVGKALDDRVGIAVLVALARALEKPPARFDVTIAATVQEEIGLPGAASLSRSGDGYDIGFIIDNSLAGDVPTVSSEHMPVSLGGGPPLVHRESSAHYSTRLIRELHAVAAREGVPVQDAVLYHYHSDGANLIRQGMETVLVARPIRYSHSPFEAIDPADLEATVALLVGFLTTAPGKASRG